MLESGYGGNLGFLHRKCPASGASGLDDAYQTERRQEHMTGILLSTNLNQRRVTDGYVRQHRNACQRYISTKDRTTLGRKQPDSLRSLNTRLPSVNQHLVPCTQQILSLPQPSHCNYQAYPQIGLSWRQKGRCCHGLRLVGFPANHQV